MNDLPDTLDTDEVRALREKRAELRAKLQKAKAETEEARTADTAARKEVERLDTAAELGEASLKEIKAARSERSQTLERLETAEAGANLEAKRRALSELEERLEAARAEGRRDAAAAYRQALAAAAQQMLDGFEAVVSGQAEVERLAEKARAAGLEPEELPRFAEAARAVKLYASLPGGHYEQKGAVRRFFRRAGEASTEAAPSSGADALRLGEELRRFCEERGIVERRDAAQT